MKMILALTAAMAASSFGLYPASAQDFDTVRAGEYTAVGEKVRLTVDYARLLQLEHSASTVILGNSGIADANLSDDKTVVLNGKVPGSTNLIVLDSDGSEVARLVLEVVAAGPHVVTVHQGQQRQTWACARRCEPVLTVGDGAEFFGNTQSQIGGRQAFSGSASGNAQ